MSKTLFLDLLPLLVYLFLLLRIGWKAWRPTADENEFLLSGRTLTVPAFVATLVTTWYGGILGIGEFVYQVGIAAWLVLGLPYYLFAVLFALFMAKRIRSAENVSIPDMMYRVYGKKSGLLSGIFIVLMTSPAPYILMLAVLVQYFLGFSLVFSILLSAFLSVIYVYWGGFRSVVQTDKLQFLFMFGGFAILIVFLTWNYFSPFELFRRLDSLHKSFLGGISVQQMVVWFFIASWTFIDPGFHQRCAAARSPEVARKGIFISVGFWFLFDTLTILSGLYGFVLLPDVQPVMVYPELANRILPPFFKGLFFVGLFATIMSTIDSYTFLSSIGIGRDILWELRKKEQREASQKLVKWGIILTAIIAILMAMLVPSVVQLWYNLGSLFIPPLLIPVLGAYWPAFRLSGKQVFILMSGSFFLGLAMFIWGEIHAISGQPQFPLGIEPFFPAIAFSFLWWGLTIRNVKR